jgi:AcrR family transcriptional regulator
LKAENGIKERILKESVRLFSEKGYHGASMRDIAAAAECSLPMLYYYYKSKMSCSTRWPIRSSCS